MKNLASRRDCLLALAGTVMAHPARATSPAPEPLTIQQQVLSARYIFTGRISRIVYLSGRTSKKLYLPESSFAAGELDLIEWVMHRGRDQLDVGSTFIEVEAAAPQLVRAEVSEDEERALATGRVYVVLSYGMNRLVAAQVDRLIGRQAVFFWSNGARHLGPFRVPLPFDVYWPSSEPPFPIGDLPLFTEIAKRAGFREARVRPR